jgi:hypothetical protein
MLLNANCKAWQSSLVPTHVSSTKIHVVVQIATYVKSPVASLCFVCSSVRNRVRVMMSVLTASPLCSPLLLDMVLECVDCVYVRGKMCYWKRVV